MTDTTTPRIALTKTPTSLTPGELVALGKYQKKGHHPTRAAAIREILREKFKSEGLL